MDTSGRNSVSYCCISKGGRVLYTFNNGGDPEVEKLAASCLDITPPYHRWYFQTNGDKKTFGFLMDDEEYLYFAVVNESLASSRVIKFLENLRDEFIKIGKKPNKRSRSLQEQWLHVIHHAAVRTGTECAQNSSYQGELTPSPCSNEGNGQFETKAPLLGKLSCKQEKRKTKDHVVGVRDTEMKEHRSSTDGDSNDNKGKNLEQSSSRARWCRQVRIVLAVDVVICIVLLLIWLVICRGTECIR